MSGGGDLEGHRDAIDAVAKARPHRAGLELVIMMQPSRSEIPAMPQRSCCLLPLLRLRAAHYHTVAQERRCASQQKLRAKQTSRTPSQDRLRPPKQAELDQKV